MKIHETALGMIPDSRLQAWKSVMHYMEPILDLYRSGDVTDIMIDAFDSIKIEQSGKIIKTPNRFPSPVFFERFIKQIGNALGQKPDDNNPILEARFPDTSRIVATFDSVTPLGATMVIRIAPKKLITFEDMITFGSVTQEMVDYVRDCIADELSMLVTGNTGAGKTSILRACAKFVHREARLLTCEDNQELYLKGVLENSVPYEAPHRDLADGVAQIDLAKLIRTALRLRPDHIWVGEIRDAHAASAWMQIGNTGHSLTASTLHANSPEDSVKRIAYLLAESGKLSYDLACSQVLANTQLFIHAKRDRRFGRKIVAISKSDGTRLIPQFIYNEASNKHEFVGSKYSLAS